MARSLRNGSIEAFLEKKRKRMIFVRYLTRIFLTELAGIRIRDIRGVS